jgi:DNA-binding GntR family transcriptional regulator
MPRYPYEQVADDLRSRIGPGLEFPPGAKLPSRAMLREQYGLSGIVIDKAMSLLRREGLTETLHGIAVYVVESHPSWAQDPDPA